MKREINLGLFVGSILLVSMGLIADSIPLLVWGLFISFFSNILYATTDLKADIVFMFFNIMIFIFLLGRIFVAYFFGYNPLESLLGLDFYDPAITKRVILLLFVSLQALFVGYYITKHTEVTLKTSLFNQADNKIRQLTPMVQKISKIILYVTFIFRIIQVIDVFLFVREEGYNAYYIAFESSIPSIVGILGSFFSIAFFTYIATMPSKKELIAPLILYLVEAIFTLGTGQRNGFALSITILAIYVLRRQNKITGLKQLSKKHIISLGGLLVAMIFIFILIGNLRWGLDSSNQGVFGKILRLFFDQGVSVNLLGYTMSLDSAIPNNKFYAFSPFIRLAKDVLSIFTEIPTYNGQTVDNALYGDAFTYTITYLIMPSEFIKGRGYGSSYIAELFTDFRWIGVIVGNLFYGFSINILAKSIEKNYIVTAFSLLTIRYLMFTPRAGFLDFVTYVFSVNNIFFMLSITAVCFWLFRYKKRLV